MQSVYGLTFFWTHLYLLIHVFKWESRADSWCVCDVHVQERSVRLFDRGDLNSYKDDLHFILTVAQCCCSARLTDTLTVKDRDRHQSTFLSLLSDITRLISTVTSQSVDAVFRPATQTRLREDLIALTRRYVAARWLRRVLISNNIAVDDMQHIQSAMLDASVRWCWLRDFVNVL